MSKDNVKQNNANDIDREARNSLVAKQVDLISLSHKTLPMLENKVVSLAISKIKKNDEIDKHYKIDAAEVYRLLGWKMESYGFLRDLMYHIASQPFGIIDPVDGTEKIVHWFNTIHLKKVNGKVVSDDGSSGRYIEITMHEDVMDYLFDLEGGLVKGQKFVTYRLQSITLFRHQYTQNLFEELLTKAPAPGKTAYYIYECGTGDDRYDIQRKIAMWKTVEDDSPSQSHRKKRTNAATHTVPDIPKSWSRYAQFDKLVLRPGKEEINRYTDLIIDYEPLKEDIHHVKHRKYVAVKFKIIRKTNQEKSETDRTIDSDYERLRDGKRYHQMSLFEMSDEFSKTNDIIDVEATEVKPVKTDDYNSDVIDMVQQLGYTKYQSGRLITEARKHGFGRYSNPDDRDWWAYDYIHYYHNKVLDKGDQIESKYNYLLSEMRADRDNQADAITQWDNNKAETADELRAQIAAMQAMLNNLESDT